MKVISVFFFIALSCTVNGQAFSFLNAFGSPITATSSLKTLVPADLNLDGNVDLVACNAYHSNLSIYLGNGSGQFSQALGSPLSLCPGPIAAAVGDFNSDGKPDLATANYLSANLTVLLGNGNGGFTQANGSPISTGPQPYSLETLDFNLDGNLDLISTSVGGSNVYLHFGQGNGSFSLAPGFPISAPGLPYHVAAGKLNNDIYPDFVVLNHDAALAYVYLGTSLGTFLSAPGSPLSTVSQPRTIRLTDLNGDGNSDMVVCMAAGSAVQAFLGSPSGSFAPAPGSPMNMGMQTYMSAVADFDLDGKQDLVVTGINNTIFLLRGVGNGSFSPIGTTLTMGLTPQPVCTADFNKDGRVDFAIGDFVGDKLHIMINVNGTGLNESYDMGEIIVFPNPVSGNVQLEWPTENTTMLLYDGFGKEMLHIRRTSCRETVSIAELPDGMYPYFIKSEGTILRSGRLVVHH